MVMFHHEIPYAVAYERGRIQGQILEELTRDARSIAQINLQQAEDKIKASLIPLQLSAR